jgi:hypothetical protein
MRIWESSSFLLLKVLRPDSHTSNRKSSRKASPSPAPYLCAPAGRKKTCFTGFSARFPPGGGRLVRLLAEGRFPDGIEKVLTASRGPVRDIFDGNERNRHVAQFDAHGLDSSQSMGATVFHLALSIC